MSGASLQGETYLPAEAREMARVYDFLAAHERAGRGAIQPRYFLAGSEAGDRVELPAEAYRVLRQVADAMQQGLAVTIVPSRQTLTTQQAADLLGISRPTLIRFLEEGKLPYERIGSHRRILLRDVLRYREERRQEQYRALEAMSQDIEDEEDLERELGRVRQARQVVGERHRGGGTLNSSRVHRSSRHQRPMA
jgi:excisionase family DNA binding protein